MVGIPLQSQNFFIACYLISLFQGETILGHKIKAHTIKHCYSAALLLFKERSLICPRRARVDYISLVYKAILQYEQVPNRRNMITDAMMHEIHKAATGVHPDSLPAVLKDWYSLARYSGFRRSEWCQKSQTDYQRITERLAGWEGPDSQALIFEDFVFYGEGERRIHDIRRVSVDDIVSVGVCWRNQKNGDNGQVIVYVRDLDRPDFCPVLASYNIAMRAYRLKVPKLEPVAVFLSNQGKRLFVTDKMVATSLQAAAMQAHNLKPEDPELKKWTSHSLRVTAACLLHRAKCSDSYIQTRLSWKSTSFLMYVRNTIYTAEAHTKALHLSTNNIPHIRQIGDNRQPPGPHDILWTAAAA